MTSGSLLQNIIQATNPIAPPITPPIVPRAVPILAPADAIAIISSADALLILPIKKKTRIENSW